MDQYRTVKNEAEDEFVERRARFIGRVKPVKTEEDAVSFIRACKSKYWDASHTVYAYSLREGSVRRYSDDGEPQGTAGVPVLEVLQKSGVTDLVVVVTRYFGGVLLGAGGLVRAYSHGAKIALDAGRIITMALCQTAELVCDYNQYGRLLSLIPEAGGVVTDTQFTDVVEISFQTVSYTHLAQQQDQYYKDRSDYVLVNQETSGALYYQTRRLLQRLREEHNV